jgi:hypothetical protein
MGNSEQNWQQRTQLWLRLFFYIITRLAKAQRINIEPVSKGVVSIFRSGWCFIKVQ